MPSQRKIMAALVVLVALVGAARAEDKQPAVKLKGIALKRLDVKSLTADATVSIEIENPGPAFTVKEATYRLKLNGEEAAEGKRDEEINVAAQSTTTVELP